MPRRNILVLLIVLLAAGGIVLATLSGGKDNDNASPSDNETATDTSEQTIRPGDNDSEVTGTTLPPISIPTTVPNAGPNDYRAILEHLIAKQNELLQNPNPARVGEIMDPTCSCYKQTREGLQKLVDNKWHVQGPATGISAAALVSKSDTTMRISATLISRGNPTVDQNGAVQEAANRGAIPPLLYVLKKQTDGRWIITDRQTYEER